MMNKIKKKSSMGFGNNNNTTIGVENIPPIST